MGLQPYWSELQMEKRNEQPDLLAIGDSWFWYPVGNLLGPINDFWLGNVTTLALAYNGAETADFLGKYKKRIVDALKGYKRKIRIIIISGGGNDFAGMENMDELIRADCAGATSIDQCFETGQPDLLFDRTMANYGALLDLIARHTPDAQVFVHNYDYAVPGKQDWIGFGQWLKNPMQLAAVPKRLQRPLINRLIDHFGDRLGALAASRPNVTFIKTAGTLKDEDWANELHPTIGGFRLMAEKRWKKPLTRIIPA